MIIIIVRNAEIIMVSTMVMEAMDMKRKNAEEERKDKYEKNCDGFIADRMCDLGSGIFLDE